MRLISWATSAGEPLPTGRMIIMFPATIPDDRAWNVRMKRSLRGVKVVEIMLRDAHGRIKGKYLNGAADFAPQSGRNLTLSLDMDLQAYGEKLMQNKLGGIVMIDTETGEILCMVSAPTTIRKCSWVRCVARIMRCWKNPHKPLF